MMMIVLVFVLCYTSFAIGYQTEPKCYSRFDYDEKMLMKLLKIEAQIEKFGDIINEMKSAHEAEALERMKMFNTELEAFKVVNAEEARRQNNLTAEIRQAIDTADAKLTDSLQKHQNATEEAQERGEIMLNAFNRTRGRVVAFTVTGPADGFPSGRLGFSTIVMNEGNSFDIATGEFKCPVSGLYYFTVHIVKKRSASIDAAGCYIQVNGVNLVRAYIDPQDGVNGADNGSYGVSNSAFVRLDVNDSVTIGGDSGATSLEDFSSFSGYLAKQGL